MTPMAMNQEVKLYVSDSRGTFTFEEWQKMPPEVPPRLKRESFAAINDEIEEHDSDVKGFIALCFFLVFVLIVASAILR